jgi:hypothetical protein
MPKQSSADAAMHAAKILIYALKHLQPATPFDIGDEQLKAPDTLANIFSKALPEPFVQATNKTKSSAALRVEPDRKSKAPFSPPEEPRKDYNTNSNRQCHQCNMLSQAWTNAITQHLSHLNAYVPLANSVIHPITGKAMEY